MTEQQRLASSLKRKPMTRNRSARSHSKKKMDVEDFSNIDWPEPWVAYASATTDLEAEKEIPPGHALYGQKLISIGRRQDCDDVLYFVPDHSFPLAVVHLTWTGKQETESRFPLSRLFGSLNEWLESCMKKDHEDFG